MVRGVFFDVYGTLLVLGNPAQAWADWAEAFYETFASHGFEGERAAFEQRCLAMFDGAAPKPPDAGLTLYETRIRRFGEEIGFQTSIACILETAARTVGAWHGQVSRDPDALSVLEGLRGSVVLAVVSNFDHPAYLRSVLERFELTRFFDTVVISGEAGVEKPDPEIFRLCLRQTGLTPGETVHVGDSEEDVLGATRAGCHAVRIVRGTQAAPAEVSGVKTIARLTNLFGVLQELGEDKHNVNPDSAGGAGKSPADKGT